MRSRSLLAASAVVCAIAFDLGGCSTPAVGAPCLPEQVPDEGFDQREAYIESSSVQCETRVCMVYQLAGDPQKDCVASETKKCATEQEVERRVYCTCRCDAGDGDGAACTCPSGFTCATVLERGDIGVRGRYCVRNDTVNRQ